MSALLLLLFILTVAVGFAAYIWLVIRAFHKGTGWGLGMLFFTPITAIIAAIQEWDEWKKPFLVYFGNSVAQLIFMMLWIASVDPMEKMLVAIENSDFGKVQAMRMIDDLESKRNLSPEEQEQLRYLKEFLASMEDEAKPDGENHAANDSDALRVSGEGGASFDSPPVRPRRSLGKIRPRAKEITINTASSHVGKEVRLEGTDGRLYNGTLTRVQPGRIWVEFYVGGGTVELEFRKHEVRSLVVRL